MKGNSAIIIIYLQRKVNNTINHDNNIIGPKLIWIKLEFYIKNDYQKNNSFFASLFV